MAKYVNIVIPENADKFLFAEDLIRNVMRRNGRVPEFTRRAGPYRQYIYNGFDETTEMAVMVLYRRLASGYSHTFQYVRNLNAVVFYDNYAENVNEVIIRCFPAGLNFNSFLLFCTHVASLAVNLDTIGVKEAPDLAVLSIVKPIQDIDMTTGGWNALNISAQRYANMSRRKMNLLSPESWFQPQEKPIDVPLGTITGSNDETGEAQKKFYV